VLTHEGKEAEVDERNVLNNDGEVDKHGEKWLK
jgi:hypothetical protein